MFSMTPLDRRSLLGAGALTGVGMMLGRASAAAGKASSRYAVQMTDAAWQAKLGADRFNVLRKEGTERPFTSALLKEHRKGVFSCAACQQPLFASSTKFESGTGWPSFYAAIRGATAQRTDTSLGMKRIEEHCSRCGGHLGHVFDDGPAPTGDRHCINGLSLTFRPA